MISDDAQPLDVGAEPHNTASGAVVSGLVVQAGSVGTVQVHHPALPLRSVPRQLPASPPGFVGRAGELVELDTALDRGAAGLVVVSALGGTGGIGKTWLALHWAHTRAERFPDGQLFADLNGGTARTGSPCGGPPRRRRTRAIPSPASTGSSVTSMPNSVGTRTRSPTCTRRSASPSRAASRRSRLTPTTHSRGPRGSGEPTGKHWNTPCAL